MKAEAAIALLQNIQSFIVTEFGEPIEFASFGKGSRKGKGNKPNCTPGKSWSCGFTCLPMSKKNCGSPLAGQSATYADYLSKQASALSKTSKKKTDGKKTYRQIADDLAKDPLTKKFIELKMGKKLSDKKMREAMGMSQDELLKLSMSVRQKLNVGMTQDIKDRIKEIYAD